MRKFALLLVGGLLILAACVPTTPAPLTIPQTGATDQATQGADVTIIPPGGTPGTGDGIIAGTQPSGDYMGTVIPLPTSVATILAPESPINPTQLATEIAVPTIAGTPVTAQQPEATNTPMTGVEVNTTPGPGPRATDAGQTSGIPLTDPQPTDFVPGVTDIVVDYDYATFIDDVLGVAGTTVEEIGTVQEPFFNVAGRQVRLNGQDVTIFEFPDQASHQAALQTITDNGGIIGAVTPYWGGRPNFYTRGNVIALYVGNDQQALEMLRGRFGDPITYGNQVGGLSADTAFRLQSRLSDRFNIGLDQIRIIDVQQQTWPDACLGLAGPNENCAQVQTPGYQVTVEVGGTRYNLRTNANASLLRFQQQ